MSIVRHQKNLKPQLQVLMTQCKYSVNSVSQPQLLSQVMPSGITYAC